MQIITDKNSHHLNNEKNQSENCLNKPSKKIMNHLWAVMQAKYSSTWKRDYSDNPYSNNGNLTVIASEWSVQLTGLTPQQIRTGIDNLSNRENKAFPPNAMEFKDLCIGQEWEEVFNCFQERFEKSSNYEWKNQLAFNLWSKWAFEYKNATNYQLPVLIKKHIKMIHKSSMMPLPDYTQKAIESKKPNQDEKTKTRIKQRFFATMTYCICAAGKVYPPKFKNLMDNGRGWEIVEEYLNKGYTMPDELENKCKSKKEFKTVFGKINTAFKESMNKFLTDVEVIA